MKSISVTFSERKHLVWGDKLMEGIFFIRELRTENSFVILSAEMIEICQTRASPYLRRELEHGSTNNQRC